MYGLKAGKKDSQENSIPSISQLPQNRWMMNKSISEGRLLTNKGLYIL